MRYGIIADDLTGGADSGLPFAARGAQTVLLLSSRIRAPKAEVLVLDADSRPLSPRRAYQRVRTAAARLRRDGFPLLYKKMDSTLRGNIGAEVDAAMDELGFSAAIVTPALPAYQRVTIDGCQFVEGRPLHETVFARESYIPRLIQSRRGIGTVPLAVVRRGPEAIAMEVRHQQPSAELFVADATTDDDLTALARAIFRQEGKWLAVGSAGLAAGLAREVVAERPALPLPPMRPGVVLVVVGSVHPATRRQATALLKESAAFGVALDPAEVFAGGSRAAAEIQRRAAELRAAASPTRRASQSRVLALLSLPLTPSVEEFRSLVAASGPQEATAVSRLVQALSAVASEVVVAGPVAGLVLTGGDMARAVCTALGAGGLALLGQFLPAIPIALLMGGRCNGLPVITKAGGFGHDDTLVRAAHFLARGGEE